MRFTIALRIVALMLSGSGVPATAKTPATSQVKAAQNGSAEAPELGRAGEFAVGTKFEDIQLPARIRLTPTGTVEAPRVIGLRLWYPAADRQGTPALYRHSLTMPDKSADEIVEHGMATEGVVPAKGSFPLVVISHGFGGWSEHLSRLGEHLASRGYVVAAIDHKDMSFDSVPGFLLSFGNVLIDRALDQRQVIAKLLDPAFAKTQPALALIDRTKVGLIGYSMGGYGALSTASAAYDPAGKPFSALPEAAKAQVMKVDKQIADRLKALVLIAPWGGQPDNRAWAAGALASIKIPTLMIDGDQDDIVNFGEGVRWLYDGLGGTDRYLLVYREARHNVAGNPVDLGQNPSMESIGYAREPVWRQERINQINQHFVTAFLDFTLKGDAAKRKFLDVPTPVASDGKWPASFGAPAGGALAGDGQAGYWRGFQRRWATGLELHHKQAGQ
jgi:alpha-beta hydrolase superfamily lysophospholipase